jgi:Flp pilus assembly pilin Flp
MKSDILAHNKSGVVMLWQRLKDERGANTVEMVMIVGTLTLLTAGVVDVGRLMTEYNAIQKGVEMGVREAVTRDPIVKPLKYHFTCNPPADSDLVGELCIADDGTQRPECDFGSFVCTDTGCTGTFNGDNYALNYTQDCDLGEPGATKDDCLSRDVFDGIVDEMQSAVPSLSPANVTVSYRSTKLGFVGMSGALPGDVTVDVTGVPFGFMASLPFGEIAWTIPRMSHTFTGEDMSDNSCADQGLKSKGGGDASCQKNNGVGEKADKLIPVCFNTPGGP